MGELHGNRALADSGGDALHRLIADVTRAEDAGNVRLEEERIAREGPAARLAVFLLEIRTGENEPMLVALHDLGNPVGPRLGTDEDEERRGLELALLATTSDGDGMEPFIAVDGGDPRSGEDGDIGRPVHLIDEILRHAVAKRVAADEHGDALRVAREEERRL